jgi:hypothetical protein
VVVRYGNQFDTAAMLVPVLVLGRLGVLPDRDRPVVRTACGTLEGGDLT